MGPHPNFLFIHSILISTLKHIAVSVCPQFVVHEAPGQELDLELFDEDTDKDDFLGRLK